MTTADKAFKEAIDFSPNWPSLTEIQDAIQKSATEEAAAKQHIILDKNDMTPGMRHTCFTALSRAMSGWPQVRDAFSTALQPHKAEIEAVSNLEKEIAELEEKARKAAEVVETKWLSNVRNAEILQEKTEADARYKEFYEAEGQRPAKNFPIWLYIIILVAIGAVEWLVNYEAFLANFGAPAMAAGFTIAVALAVAVASHEHGTVLKQREHFFGDDISDRKKVTKIVWLGVVSFGLIGALTFVGWNRYSWAMDIIAKAFGGGSSLLGHTALPTVNVTQKVLMSVIANVLVWVLGTAIAYWVHDTNPDFTAALRRKLVATKRFQKARAPVDSEIRTTVGQLEKEIKAKRNIAKAQHEAARIFRDQRDQVDSRSAALLKECERRLKEYVADYQYMLTAAMIANGNETRLNRGGALILPQDYQALEINVPIEDVRAAIG